MTNQSNLEGAGRVHPPRSAILIILCWFLTALLVACALFAPKVIESFAQVYVSFAVEIPPAAMLVIEYRYIWWLLPLAAVALAMLATRQNQPPGIQTRIAIGAVALFLLSFALVSIAAGALYVPIFNLGK